MGKEKVIMEPIHVKSKYINEQITPVFRRYERKDGPTALILNDLYGQQVAKVSVNFDGNNLPDDEIAVKTYSENEWLMENLIKQGFLEDTGREQPATPGYSFPIYA